MRICFVSTELAGYHGGGIGTYVAEAGKALTAAGHEVWLITSDPGKDQRQNLRQHPDFHRVLFADEHRGDGDHYALAHETYAHAARVHAALSSTGVVFDYIEFPDYLAEGYVALRDHRLFDSYGQTLLAVTLHSPTHEIYQYNEQLHLITPKFREICILEEDAIRNAPALNAPSTRLLEMVRVRLGLSASHGEVIRYPITLDADLPPPPPPRRSLDELSFLYYGRIEPRKGVQHLIEAFAGMPELQIELIGRDGSYSPTGESYVEWLSRHLPANVKISPPLPREEMLQRITQSDVCVLPSPWENWPNTCIEAMAAGRIVIGGRNGGMGEMIEDGVSGFLVDGSDPADIARVIVEELGSNLNRLDEIGTAAARRIREISDPDTYVTAIEERVANHHTPPEPPPPAQAKVSIIVPYHDEDEAMLGEAIDSAIAQTWTELEILIVNDGSPRPDAASILAHMEAKDPRIRVLHKENGGLASARNLAVEQATGDIFLFLDADNVLRPQYAQTGVEVLDRFPEIAGIVPEFQIFEDDTRRPRVISNPLPFDQALCLLRNSFGDAGAMLRGTVFREHGLRYDPAVDVYSDWALWLDCAQQNLQIECVPRILYDYRRRPDSMYHGQAWERHLPLLGLLIERHLPQESNATDRELLVTLAHGWGVGAILTALGGSPIYSDQPALLARNIQSVSASHWLADSLAKIARKIPGLSTALRKITVAAMRWHGDRKDRRQRR